MGRILPCRWIDRSRQAIRQRHVEHVVSWLSGRITGPPGRRKGDLKAAETWLVGDNTSIPPPPLLAVERESSSNTNTESFAGGKE